MAKFAPRLNNKRFNQAPTPAAPTAPAIVKGAAVELTPDFGNGLSLISAEVCAFPMTGEAHLDLVASLNGARITIRAGRLNQDGGTSRLTLQSVSDWAKLKDMAIARETAPDTSEHGEVYAIATLLPVQQAEAQKAVFAGFTAK
jgi:hypothetical protein